MIGDFLRKLIFATYCVALQTSQASALDLICMPEGQVSIMPSSSGMKPRVSEYTTLHRFSGSKLYVTDWQDKRGELFYGDVREAGYNRYVSGNKTIDFGFSDKTEAIVSHVDSVEGRLYVLKCSPETK